MNLKAPLAAPQNLIHARLLMTDTSHFESLAEASSDFRASAIAHGVTGQLLVKDLVVLNYIEGTLAALNRLEPNCIAGKGLCPSPGICQLCEETLAMRRCTGWTYTEWPDQPDWLTLTDTEASDRILLQVGLGHSAPVQMRAFLRDWLL